MIGDDISLYKLVSYQMLLKAHAIFISSYGKKWAGNPGPRAAPAHPCFFGRPKKDLKKTIQDKKNETNR
jgi:hypothetical protein